MFKIKSYKEQTPMKVIFAKEKLIRNKYKKTIFLAGPSPRNSALVSWREEAIELFEENKFEGTLLIPEHRELQEDEFNYIDQIDWEEEGLKMADIILFWIPRDLEIFPGFTTNVEWGYWTAKNPSKLVLGSPDDAPKMMYLNHYADKLDIPRFNSLEALVKFTIGEK